MKSPKRMTLLLKTSLITIKLFFLKRERKNEVRSKILILTIKKKERLERAAASYPRHGSRRYFRGTIHLFDNAYQDRSPTRRGTRNDENTSAYRHARWFTLASSTVLFAVSFDTIMELSKSNERWSMARLLLPPMTPWCVYTMCSLEHHRSRIAEEADLSGGNGWERDYSREFTNSKNSNYRWTCFKDSNREVI